MKKIHFFINSKGGVGKTFLNYLIALMNESNEKSLFVDVDSSAQKADTSPLNFLSGRTPARLSSINLLDERERIDRAGLFASLEDLAKTDYEDIYLDFGATESADFPALVTREIKPKDFKAFEEHLKVKFVFHFVVAGGTDYVRSTQYLSSFVSLIAGLFEIYIRPNQKTFYGFGQLLEELKTYSTDKKNKITGIREFGDFDVTNAIGKEIVANMEQGKGKSELAYATKLKLNNEFEKLAL